MFTSKALLAAILVAQLPSLAHAHGRLINPPSRMSAWRFGFDVPINYNDHEQYCGGFANQWNVNGGKCGICGDPWQGPRKYERPDGKLVPKLVITRTYKAGETINVDVEVTVNHLGWFEFRLCDVRNSGGKEATQACLDQHLMADRRGKTRFDIGSRKGLIKFRLVLPPGLTCPQCVMQWKWHCANNVGYGEKQEEFYACSDVTITSTGATPRPTITERPVFPTNPPIIVTQRPTNPPIIVTQRPTNPPPIYVTNRPTNPPPIFVTITNPPRVTLPPYLLIRLGDKSRPLAERIQEYTRYQQTHISGYKIWDAGHLAFKPRYDPRLATNILRRGNSIVGNAYGTGNNYNNNNNGNAYGTGNNYNNNIGNAYGTGNNYNNNNNNNNGNAYGTGNSYTSTNKNNAIGSNYGNAHNNNDNTNVYGKNNNNGGALGSNYGNTHNNYNTNRYVYRDLSE